MAVTHTAFGVAAHWAGRHVDAAQHVGHAQHLGARRQIGQRAQDGESERGLAEIGVPPCFRSRGLRVGNHEILRSAPAARGRKNRVLDPEPQGV